MATVGEVLVKLRKKARAERLAGMARYGIVTEGRLGVSVPDMRKLAKELGRDHELAVRLWETGFQEARIVAALIDDPRMITEEQMEGWVRDFNSWDVCDQVCMNLFDRTALAWKKVRDWSSRDEEFVKRAAFSLIACLAWHDREADDKRFIELLPLIEDAATDERNYVKKAVNWALRHIGKRNRVLNREALKAAREIQKIDSRSARWIASDAIRELETESVQKRLNRNDRDDE